MSRSKTHEHICCLNDDPRSRRWRCTAVVWHGVHRVATGILMTQLKYLEVRATASNMQQSLYEAFNFSHRRRVIGQSRVNELSSVRYQKLHTKRKVAWSTAAYNQGFYTKV
jgi:hypothetical protein